MKPAAFEYSSPGSVDEALALVQREGEGGRILAGGQSLVALMNLRMAFPEHLIDLNGVGELSWVRCDSDLVSIGAMTRQREVERSSEVAARIPALTSALGHVGHFQIRNRGTVGGSICHADGAAELPGLLLACDGWVEARSVDGDRRIPADDFFLGPFTTALRPNEVVTSLGFPVPPEHTGWSFQEVARRQGDFAVVGVAAFLQAQGRRITKSTVVVIGGAGRPLRMTAAEQLLDGNDYDTDLRDAAAASAAAGVSPTDDAHASADTRRHLVGVLVRRTLDEAFSRTNGVAR